MAEAGAANIEHIMERKRTTIQDCRGYLRRHLAPFFGIRTLDPMDATQVTAYLLAKRRAPQRPVPLRCQARVGDREPVALVDRPPRAPVIAAPGARLRARRSLSPR